MHPTTELRSLIRIHDAIADLNEQIGCHIIDLHGSMQKSREKDKANEEAEHAECMDEQWRERAAEVL